MAPPASDPANSPPQRPRRTAREVFLEYGTWSLVLIGWEIWCIRDGWFRPGYEHITFSRIMAYLSGPFLIFCLVMSISAGLTWRNQKPPPPPS